MAAIRTNFWTAYREVPEHWQKITGAPQPVDQEETEYDWIDELSGFDFWDDKGSIPELVGNAWQYKLKVRPYGGNFTIKDKDIRFDKTRQLYTRAAQIGNKAGSWKNAQLATTIQGATSGNLFDGKPFFSATHPTTPGSTNSNLGTAALTADSLETVIWTMQQYKGRSGDLLGVTPTHLVIPPQLQGTAARILNSSLLPGTAQNDTNFLMGMLQPIILPDLGTDANDWGVFDLSKPVKPFFAIESLPLRTMTSEGTKDEGMIKRREITFSADGEMAFGKSLWFLGYWNSVT